MQWFVIDTNIIFASAINPNSKNLDMIFLLDDLDIKLYTPVKIYEEIQKHIAKIANKKKFSANLLEDNIMTILSYIKLINSDLYSNLISDNNKKLQNIDPNDVDFVSLAQKLWVPLWTNDKALIEKVDWIEIVDTEHMIQKFL